MKILFIHRSNDYTGSTRALATLLETEYKNQEVCVLTSDDSGGGFLSELSNVHIKKTFCPILFGKRIKLVSYFFQSIHLFVLAFSFGCRFDIFYINTITPFPAVIAGWLLRKKITYHIHEKFIEKTFDVTIMEFVLRHTSGTHYIVSEYLRNQYSNLIGELQIRYNYLAPSFLEQVDLVPPIERTRKNIIMISSLSEAKGVYQFIELSKVMPEHTFRLVLSVNQETISKQFGHLEMNNLTLIPAQNSIHEFLRMSDLLLNLSNPNLWVETFGLTILEAMAYGIPSIVPNIGGPTELVLNSYNGYCVDVTNIDDICDAINKVLEKDNYISMANNSLERLKMFI